MFLPLGQSSLISAKWNYVRTNRNVRTCTEEDDAYNNAALNVNTMMKTTNCMCMQTTLKLSDKSACTLHARTATSEGISGYNREKE